MGFGAEMGKGVNALSNKMETFDLPLVIKMLELDGPLEKKFVGELELLRRNSALVGDAYPNDQLAVVTIVYFRQYSIEEARSQTIEIQQQFPSFVTARKFFRRVLRCTIERTREVHRGVCNGLAMSLPDVSL